MPNLHQETSNKILKKKQKICSNQSVSLESPSKEKLSKKILILIFHKEGSTISMKSPSTSMDKVTKKIKKATIIGTCQSNMR